MSSTRPSLKQLSFALTLLMLRIFNEQMVIAANDSPQTIMNDMITVDLYDLSIHNPIAFKSTLEKIDYNDLIALGEAKLSLLITDIARRKEYEQLYLLLQTAPTPEPELHRSTIMLTLLSHYEPVINSKSGLLLLQLCYLIDEFKPSTVIGRLIHETATTQWKQMLPTLDSLRLDYHVMKMDFKRARKYLHSDLPDDYIATFNRLAKRAELLETKAKPSIFELLQHNQVRLPGLPYANAVLKKAIGDIPPGEALKAAGIHLLTKAETEALEKRPSSKAHEILMNGEAFLSQAEINLLNQALLETDNPYVKFSRKLIQTDLLTRKKPDNNKEPHDSRESLRASLHVLTSMSAAQVHSYDHKLLLATQKINYLLKNADDLKLDRSEMLLSLRSILTNNHELTPEQLAICLDLYEKAIHSDFPDSPPLFFTYDILDEKFIRQHYPASKAEAIIKREKALAQPKHSSQPDDEFSFKKLITAVAYDPVLQVATALSMLLWFAGISTNYRRKQPTLNPAPQARETKKSKKRTRVKHEVPRPSTQPFLAPITPEVKSETLILPPTQPEPIIASKPIIKPIVLSPQEKINKLISKDRFPTEARTAWVKIPTTTFEEFEMSIGAHASDAAINTQLPKLASLYHELIQSKTRIDALQNDYVALVKAYDETINPSDEFLRSTESKIRNIQVDADKMMQEIKNNSETYEQSLLKITTRISKLEAQQKPARESDEARKTRLANLKAAKAAAKAERAEQANQAARIAEAEARRAAEQTALNETRLKEALLNRAMEPSPTVKLHFRYAHNALLILNDIAQAKQSDEAYLRDACVLSCTQLYEALTSLSTTLFGTMLPNTERLAKQRNIFAHDATYSDCNWKQIAADAYQTYFPLIDAFHRVQPQEAVIKVTDIPEIPLNDNIARDDKIANFRALCERYQVFSDALNRIYNTHEKRETPIQHEEINLIVVAMRGLILQIDDVGNAIGITAKNKHLGMLAGSRNEEAHNGDRTNIITLINLNEAVQGLAKRIKPRVQRATPSRLGMYAPRARLHTEPTPQPKPGH